MAALNPPYPGAIVEGRAGTLAALRARAWRALQLHDNAHEAELADEMIVLARRIGDAEAEAYGLFHAARACVHASIDVASRAAQQALSRCRVLAVPAAVGLCEDMLAYLQARAGRIDDSIAHFERRVALARRPLEHCFMLRCLSVGYEWAGRFDDAIRCSYRHLALAAALDNPIEHAIALNNLGAWHESVFNVEDARPLLEQALVIFEAERAPWVHRARAATNLALVCHLMGLHAEARGIVERLLADRAAIDQRLLRQCCGAIALAYLGAGCDERAQALLELGPYDDSDCAESTISTWHWARGLWLCRQGRFDEARQLCRSRLAAAATRPGMDSPQGLVQLYQIVASACEALGDPAGALHALRAARALAAPMVASSVRAHLIAMQAQQGVADDPRARDAWLRRVQAVESETRDYVESLNAEIDDPAEEAEAHAPGRAEPPQSLLAEVSRQMHAPLDDMLGMTSLLLVSQLDERQRRFALVAKTSAETLRLLVNDILDLAHIESGQYRLDPQPFAVAPLLQEVIDLFAVQADKKGIGLGLRLAPALPPTIGADRLRLRQVLTNLVGNAIKFTAQGAVTVSAAAAAPGRVRFEVHDTGKGIGENAQARLFTEFMQEDRTIAGQYGGTGLGLALSRQLVRLMGGEIGVASRLGAGSTFWIELPAAARAIDVDPRGGPAAIRP